MEVYPSSFAGGRTDPTDDKILNESVHGFIAVAVWLKRLFITVHYILLFFVLSYVTHSDWKDVLFPCLFFLDIWGAT